MADENDQDKDLDQNVDPSPDDPGDQDQDKGSADKGDDGAKPEPQVPLSRLREEVGKREKLEKELGGLKGNKEVPDDEKRIREILTKAQKEERENEVKAQKEIDSKLDGLKKIHGDFNKENLLKIVDEYGVYNEDGSVKWDKAMELYNRLGGNPKGSIPKKKMPQANRTGDDLKKEPFDPSKKTMWEIAEEAKRELPQ